MQKSFSPGLCYLMQRMVLVRFLIQSEIVSQLKHKIIIVSQAIKGIALGDFKKGSGLQTQFQV